MRFLVAGIIILLLSACLNKPDCIVAATNRVKIALLKVEKDTIHYVRFSLIKVSGTDSLFQNVKDSVSSLVLPLNPRAIQTTFKFQYKTKINSSTVVKTDSVTLGYVPQNVIISPECGGYIFYTNLLVISSSFDQTGSKKGEIVNPRIISNQLSTSASNINLQIKL